MTIPIDGEWDKKINLTGNIGGIVEGTKELAKQLNFELDKKGIKVIAEKSDKDNISVKYDGETISIGYLTKNDFFRGLAIAVSNLKIGKTEFKVTENRAFTTCGAMVDLSRDAVLNIHGMNMFIRYLALMGHNTLYLYMEDTYRIDGYEYFGYMRGAYTKDELKAIVKYASVFDIEVIPCIQTLGHLYKTLKWRYSMPIKDTSEILLIDEPETYKFIDAMLKTVKECFPSDKVHLGIDEAHSVGMGAYYQKHGPSNRLELLCRHLKKVKEIADSYGLESMMWSDMFFKLGTPSGNYYDPNAQMPDNISDIIPQNMGMVYWDYYTQNEKTCDALIKQHLKMNRPVIFAGGIHIWGNLMPNYRKTFDQTNAEMKACRKNGIKNVFATLWGDNGAETNIFSALLGLQLFAEYNFYETVTDEHLEKMFKICTHCDMKAFFLLGADGNFENESTKQLDDMWDVIQISKQIMYQDILMGLFDENFKNDNLALFYKKAYDELCKVKNQGDMEFLFEYNRILLKTLIGKSDIGMRLCNAYKENDKDKMRVLAVEIGEITKNIEQTHRLLTNNWLYVYKPFGLDVIDLRFGGVVARCNRAKERIEDYLSGKIQSIPELEEKRLIYNNTVVNHDLPTVYEWRYGYISTVQIM